MTIHDDLREVMGLLGNIVPPQKPLPDLLLATYHEARGWNACREAMLALIRQHGPALLAAAKYEEANPLGGPATMLEAAARRIRAGEDFHEVLADYGLLARQEVEDAERWITAWRNRFIDEKTSRLQAGASMYYEEARAHAEESANQFEAAFAEELRKRAEAARSGGGG